MKTLRNLTAATLTILVMLTSCDQNPIDPTDIIDKEINPEIPAKPTTDPGEGCKWSWDAYDWQWERECDEKPVNPENPGENGSGPEYSNDMQGAIKKSLAIFDGQVTETETDQDWGETIYKVEITNNRGDEVDFKWKASNGKLYKIQSDSEPVTYDLDPGNGLITLGEAMTIAR